jgi:ADP-ribose pyrophosphatase
MLEDKPKRALKEIEKVYETEWFSIEALKYDSSQGQPYYRLSGNDSVVIVAMTTDHKLVMIRQFRPAVGAWLLELPAGQIDKNETAEKAIARELKEETGYECESIQFVGKYRVDPCRINSQVHTFIGKGARKVSEKNADEDLDVILMSEIEFQETVLRGDFVTVSGLGFYYLCKLKGLL